MESRIIPGTVPRPAAPKAARAAVLAEYMGAPVGSASGICPACGGGSGQERSLSITVKTNGLLWKCHRASCGFAGRSTTGPASARQEAAPWTPRPLPVGEWRNWSRVIPLCAFDGTLLGHQTRRPGPDGRKEVRTWPLVQRPLYDAHMGVIEPRSLWIVEDTASARASIGQAFGCFSRNPG